MRRYPELRLHWFHLVLDKTTYLPVEWFIIIDQKLFEDDSSVIIDRFSYIKQIYVSVTKNLVNPELLLVGQLLAVS